MFSLLYTMKAQGMPSTKEFLWLQSLQFARSFITTFLGLTMLPQSCRLLTRSWQLPQSARQLMRERNMLHKHGLLSACVALFRNFSSSHLPLPQLMMVPLSWWWLAAPSPSAAGNGLLAPPFLREGALLLTMAYPVAHDGRASCSLSCSWCHWQLRETRWLGLC